MQQPGGPGPEETRNMMIAMALIAVLLVVYQYLYPAPQPKAPPVQSAQSQQQQNAGQTPEGLPEAGPGAIVSREEALSRSADARAPIETGAVDGSISLVGARFDDLNLKGYLRTLKADSGEVSLLEPINTEFGQEAYFGWQARHAGETGISDETPWSAPAGARLTPETPLVLSYASPEGLHFTRTISIDANYMLTIEDRVDNRSDAIRELRPYGVVRRHNKPEDYRVSGVVHQGFVGVFGPKNEFFPKKFEDADKFAKRKAKGETKENERFLQVERSPVEWLGITDHYWMTAMVLPEGEQAETSYNATQGDDGTDYRASYIGTWREIPAGGSVSFTQRLFAGAKRVDLLQSYEKTLNINQFDKGVDWGNFWFLTRPFFMLLDFLYKQFGQFGIAIMVSTVVIKALLFPLVYQSFKSMAKMRQIQPKMKELQERFAADKQRLQQEQMRLFQTEKINPLAGCLPLLFQMPVFFALYKVLTVTIEMRHTPFVGWIHDLSAKDPTNLLNLFGLLPYDPANVAILSLLPAIGIWPILNGLTMFGLQSLSPPPADPVQANVFKFMPILYTLLFAGLASGLVIYYTWSNLITIGQQYFIMRRQGTETQLDKFLAKYAKRPAEEKT